MNAHDYPPLFVSANAANFFRPLEYFSKYSKDPAPDGRNEKSNGRQGDAREKARPLWRRRPIEGSKMTRHHMLILLPTVSSVPQTTELSMLAGPLNNRRGIYATGQ
jgi:hypothetical protein